MSDKLNLLIAKVICGWMDTHDYKTACKEAVAAKLSERIITRLDRAQLLVERNGDFHILRKG